MSTQPDTQPDTQPASAAEPLESRVLRVLRAAYQQAAATDAANAAANLATEVRERPLTRELRETHDALYAALIGEDGQ